MLDVLASAGGFGGSYDAVPHDWSLAPDAAPKLVLIAALVIVLGAWVWYRLRLLER